MQGVKQLLVFSLSWLLIKQIWCLVQSGQKVKSPFKILKGPFGVTQCIKECLLRTRCQTLGYNSEQLRCELGGSKDIQDVSDPDYQTAFRTDLSEFQELLGQCATPRCDAGRKCILTKSDQLECITSDCDTKTGYLMINSSDDYACLKVYAVGGATYKKSASQCQQDGGRLMIIDKAWKFNTVLDLLPTNNGYFINGFKNEDGAWKFSDGNDFVRIAGVEYASSHTSDRVVIGKNLRRIGFALNTNTKYGFVCEM